MKPISKSPKLETLEKEKRGFKLSLFERTQEKQNCHIKSILGLVVPQTGHSKYLQVFI